MEFKCRESGHQKLAVGLSLKFHKERRERTTNRRSMLQFLQILFQIRSLYYQNDLNLLGKPEGEKTVELAWGNMPGHIQSSTQNKFDMVTTISLQNNNSRFNLSRFANCDSCVLPWRATKKILSVTAGNRNKHFQSYLSDWLWCYQSNDSAKYYFQIHLTSNWKFWELSVLAWKATKKKIYWLSQQETENSNFRVIFWIGFDVANAMILQNAISRFIYFQL